jgi:hypothetical protein
MARRWNSKSVKSFAQGNNPVRVMQDKCESLIIQAVDNGWQGPPYDPFALCKILNIQLIANPDIPDARIFLSLFKPTIEYNPNQSSRRIKFSIAHEIAHTLFNDWEESTHYRHEKSHSASIDWELESLCNLGASELLLPFSTIPELAAIEPNLKVLLHLQKVYDVSLEALTIRFVKNTNSSCLVFVASPVDERPKYKIDYLLKSEFCKVKTNNVTTVPESSYICEPHRVGEVFFIKEDWLSDENTVLEGFALPPNKNSLYPRVLCILRSPEAALEKNTRGIKYVTGDVTEPKKVGNRILTFVVNDKSIMWGGGVAKLVGKKHSDAQIAYKSWCMLGERKLGSNFVFEAEEDLTICALVAQKGFGSSLVPRIKYVALGSCFEQLSELAIKTNSSIHMPRIGMGQASGSWEIIEEMIFNRITSKDIKTFVYDYSP